MTQNTLIVVLGMHRGGTSAIARMLPVFGVSLGDQLLPAVEGDNDKGYWEDVALHELNEAMLAFLGRRWTSLSAISKGEIESLCASGFLTQAANALQQKYERTNSFGFKDPRTARLLPFWQRVFDACGLRVHYLIASRNPKSVVASLVKSRGVHPVLGYHLWFHHLLEGLSGSEGSLRVVVDYDALLKDPETELSRVSKALELPFFEEEGRAFCNEFLDQALRHSRADLDSIHADEASFELAGSLYQLLKDCSQTLDSEKFQDGFSEIVGQAAVLSSIYPYVGQLEHELFLQAKELYERLKTIEETEQGRLDQAERARILQEAVEFQQVELANRLRVIEETEQGRLDQAERARILQEAVECQQVELADRLRVIEETEQGRLDQAERAHVLSQAADTLRIERDSYFQELNLLEMKYSAKIAKHAELEKKLLIIQREISKLSQEKKVWKTETFDSRFYLKTNTDVRQHGADPLVHYLFHGLFEGRSGSPPRSRFAQLRRAISRRGGLLPSLQKVFSHAIRGGFPRIFHELHRAQLEDLSGVSSAKIRSLDYSNWHSRHVVLNEADRSSIRRSLASMRRQTKVSFLMPVYNPPTAFLERAIDSVRNQLYDNWELCIANDASTDPAVTKCLLKYAQLDTRIRVIHREKNGHISAASNSALALATGQYVALIDHDDEVTEDALFWIVRAIEENPDLCLIYSDEDKLTEKGVHYDPYFKPDFDPVLLLAQNTISHLGVYRTSLVRKIGGFREGFEGAQDYDLVLRFIDQCSPCQILHIPRILYHWRAISGSTALASGEKNYAAEAGQRAVADYLSRRVPSALVVPAPEAPHLNRVIFPRPPANTMISILIPTRDRADILGVCVDSILERTDYAEFEIIVIDNGSVESATFDLFSSWPKDRIRVIRHDAAFNFSTLNNVAAEVARGELLCLMNNDIEIISRDWAGEMASFAIQEEVGCVGARLWYPDDTLQHGGVITGIGGVAGHAHKRIRRGECGYFGRAVLHQSFSVVTAAALMIRRTVYQEVGGLEEQLAIAFNDVDFCLRVRNAGYRNVWTPFAEMIHHESISRGHEDSPEKLERFHREWAFMTERWGKTLVEDPCYNPNLTLDHEDFSISFPPRSSRLASVSWLLR